jgi:hypothetical protein
MTKWITGRKVLTVTLVAIATVELERHNLSDGNFVYLMLGCLAGHNLATVLSAWRGPSVRDPK